MRSRRWEFVAQEAKRLAGLGMSRAEIAKKIGVDKSTVTRWMQAGKLPTTSDRPATASAGPVRPNQSPSEWAASIRAAYALDPTDDQLVTLGEQALRDAVNPNATSTARSNSARTFQGIARQLALAARTEPQQAAQPEAPAQEPAPRRNPPVQRTNTGDPRGILSAVNG